MADRSDKPFDTTLRQPLRVDPRAWLTLADLERIERAILRLLDAASWDDALADP
jgi:hypothetical protein